MYEKKLLTYPRTDSNYLTEDMAAILEDRVRAIRPLDDESVDGVLAEGLNIDSRIINDKKVSDHHAIIPTENIGSAVSAELTKDEKAILELVLKRFLAALSGQYEYTETEYVFDVSGEKFKYKCKVPARLGWKKFYSEKESENAKALSFSEGETFDAGELAISECETKPPKRFTEDNGKTKDTSLTFEQLGFDSLVVDEAHNCTTRS